MKKQFLLLALMAFAIFLIGCKDAEIGTNPDTAVPDDAMNADDSIKEIQQPEAEDTGAKAKPVFHKDFSLEMPLGWKEIEIPPSTFMYLLEDQDYTDPNTEAINIMVSQLHEEEELDLDAIAKSGIEESKELLPDLELITGPVKSTMGKEDALKLAIEVTISGKKMRYTQLFTEKFNSLFVITHACLADDCEHDAEFEQIISSMELKDSRQG